jgi:DNA-binding transcriptional LysR family regulator
MDIHRLCTFCAVFEQQSFSKAGMVMHLAQPTISAHISDLEKELNVALFDRFPRRIIPTQAAEILYAHAQTMIQAREKAAAEIAFLSGAVNGNLRLGGSTIPAHYILPQQMSYFLRKYPQVDIILEIDDSQSIEKRIQEGSLDIGIIGGRENVEYLTYQVVAEDELWLLAPPGDFFLSPKKRILPEAGWPWIVREPGSGTRKAMQSYLQTLGISWDSLTIRATVSSTQAVMACIQAGLGVSMVSSLAAQGPVYRKEVQRLAVGECSHSRSFYAAIHSRRTLLPAARTFVRHMTRDQEIQSNSSI